MGQAKQKRMAEQERREAEEQRRREERAKRNTPKGRRDYLPKVIKINNPEKPGVELGTFQLHPDGKVYVYTKDSPLRRVKDPRVVELVHARYRELHPVEAPAEAGSA